MQTFEGQSTGAKNANTLAPLITEIEPKRRPLTEFIDLDNNTGAVAAPPGSIYDAAR